MKFIQDWREKRKKTQLSDAILSQDIDKVTKALDNGATLVDMTQVFETYYGNVPKVRIQDPVEFARETKAPTEIIALLESRLSDQPDPPKKINMMT